MCADGECRAHSSQMRVLDLLSRVTGNHELPIWVLGSELGSSVGPLHS